MNVFSLCPSLKPSITLRCGQVRKYRHLFWSRQSYLLMTNLCAIIRFGDAYISTGGRLFPNCFPWMELLAYMVRQEESVIPIYFLRMDSTAPLFQPEDRIIPNCLLGASSVTYIFQQAKGVIPIYFLRMDSIAPLFQPEDRIIPNCLLWDRCGGGHIQPEVFLNGRKIEVSHGSRL
jgi:hypothetical protein